MKSQTTDRYNLTINANHVSLGNAINDAAEQHFGRNDHNRAHGDETAGSLHDHWHTLQAFAGAGQ